MTSFRPHAAAAMRFFILVMTACAGVLLTGCNQTEYPYRDPTYVHNVPVDSIVFWPPSLRYARAGDTVSFRVIGLKRGYVCARILEMGWTWRDDSTSDYYTLHSLVELPGNPTCAVDNKGADSLFKVIFPTLSGQKLFVQTSAGVSTDSLVYVAGDGYTDIFTHRISDPDSAGYGGRFLFHDSGATQPRRFVTADSMATCETFQSAAYKRSGDTLTVRVRRIHAVELSPAIFPPCAGPHADTMDVVLDQYRFP